MDILEDPCTWRLDSHEQLPSLIKYISAQGLTDFDTVEEWDGLADQLSEPNVFSLSARESGVHSVSISMPPSPTGRHIQIAKRVLFCDHDRNLAKNVQDTSSLPETAETCEDKFYSQPMPKGAIYLQSNKCTNFIQHPHRQPGRDARFDPFKTLSGRLERQLSILRGIPVEPEPEIQMIIENDALPVDRYFDALEGPELDTLKPLEQSVLPDDRDWPFLLRYTISSFGICLGVSSQAILWKTLATSASTKFLHISLKVNLILWIISVLLVVTVGFIYILKLIFYFEAVCREYYHPIRVNFFFAPWIALLFLCLGVPPSISQTLPHALWYVLMTPIFCLELKIYGQWMSGGQRRLSKVANPSNHLSIVGNFVGALLGASIGLKEGPLFFFAIGLAHYTVLFVTLYQRLPTNETLPKELHPVFFLFVAAPSVASMAWAKIQGSFDYGARIIYFIALFLYFSLAVRVNFFRGFRFSLAWWAYTFPMTGAAIATIRYSNEVRNLFTQILSVTLCTLSTLMVTALLGITIVHAFMLRDLFPNDSAIAVSGKPPILRRKWFHLGNGGSGGTNDFMHYLKFFSSDGKEMEVAVNRDGKIMDAPSNKPFVDDVGEC
ncbi:hypothetical protein V2J09_005776 [Rumex salicifolius]